MCLTVTKKARLRQSYDLNLKAWDNEADLRVTVLAFVGFKDLWEIMVSALPGVWVYPASPLRRRAAP